MRRRRPRGLSRHSLHGHLLQSMCYDAYYGGIYQQHGKTGNVLVCYKHVGYKHGQVVASSSAGPQGDCQWIHC